jgi:RNA polymerase sporulation-specific sigma factor
LISDEQLAARMASGEEFATRLLLDRLSGLIGGASLSFFASGLERQDFEQEARIAIHEAARSFDSSTGIPFGSFASHVVKRRMIDAVKKAQRQKHRSMNEALLFSMPVGNEDEDLSLGDTLAELRSSEPVDVLGGRTQFAAFVRLVSGGLSPIEHAVAVGRMEGESYDQMSARLGASHKSIDNALQRVRVKIERALEAEAA